MNISKGLTVGLLLAPALAFGMETGSVDRSATYQQERQHERPAAQQHGMAHEQRTEQRFLSQVNGRMVSIDSLMGSSARTSDGEEVGNIEDILVDADGSIKAVVVGVGGFLGIGAKDVAISWDQVSVVPDNGNGQAASATHKPDDFVLRVNVTEDALREAPEFDRNW